MRSEGAQINRGAAGPQITGLTHGQCATGTDLMCTTKAVIPAQRDCRVGINRPVTTEYVGHGCIGTVQVQRTQHLDGAGTQRTRPGHGHRGHIGNMGLAAQATVGGTDRQITAVNIQGSGTGQAACHGRRPARSQIECAPR
ncbi:Uncharacterised protein [Yersinia wautersii]|uniref:Uncharacterized protein n=1 Tax=Yersinia wautersii TaxID=1341643 RepID=A0ABP1ZJG5_9GAMM|nr:Uncharacterised protein [Yersinia wautersii]